MALRKRSQAATEYIMIVGFVMVLLTPLTYLIYSYSQQYSSEVAHAQALDIGSRIVDSAESIFYFGEPSRITLDVSMPSGITGMAAFNSNFSCSACTELRFYFADESEVIAPSFVRINFTDAARWNYGHVTVYNASSRSFSPGKRSFQLYAFNDYVEVRTLGG